MTAGGLSAEDIRAIGCLVQARDVAEIGAATRGVILRIDVDRADRVSEGQVVASLEASEEESTLALAEMKLGSDISVRLARAKAEAAEANAERLTTLVKQNLTKRADQEEAVLSARAARLEEEEALLDHDKAKVEVRAALAALERKKVRAPFDGVVTERRMSVGELYTEQVPILVVARIDPLSLEAYLPASARPAVAVGQDVDVTLEDGTTHTARIELLDPLLDAATGTFGLRLALPNPEGKILAGQSCQLKF